jgi:short-subunit dehydrogenase
MKNIALITGASTGIGRDLARIHAEQGGDLVIIARRQPALAAVKSELEGKHGVRVLTIAADLTEPGTIQRIHQDLGQQGIKIDILINNAGFGGHGKFHQRDWNQEQSMIDLNIKALCEMTHVFVQDMIQQGQGRILNVASTAGFLPGPLQAVYYATKAFVVSFSQAIAEELSDTGVSVTALCPGPVKTEFIDRAGLENVNSFRHAADSRDVAQVGYRAMMKGQLIVFNDWKLSFLLGWVVPWLPRRTVLRLSRQMMEKG